MDQKHLQQNSKQFSAPHGEPKRVLLFFKATFSISFTAILWSNTGAVLAGVVVVVVVVVGGGGGGAVERAMCENLATPHFGQDEKTTSRPSGTGSLSILTSIIFEQSGAHSGWNVNQPTQT